MLKTSAEGVQTSETDNVVKMLHWKLCEKCGFKKAEKWYIHKSEKVLESEDWKILWDFPILSDKTRYNCY